MGLSAHEPASIAFTGMSTISVTLPDGKILPMAVGSTVLDVAREIGPGLAKAALAGRIDGRKTEDEKVLFNNNGHEGLQFPSVAAVIYREAVEQGLGVELPNEIFLQDIKN